MSFTADGGVAELPAEVPCLALPLGCPGVVEVWETSGEVRYAREQGFALAVGEGVLFGTIEEVVRDGTIEAVARSVYDRLFAVLDAHSTPHLVRVHNIIPKITRHEAAGERYRSFNTGRFAAFAARRREAVLAPAATGIGVPDDRLRLSFLAMREPGVPVENPRQVQAYAYPSRYGTTSPTFSRATKVGGMLLVSGTASIVGHESRHAGDVGAQAEEIGRNLDALAAAAGIVRPDGTDRTMLKVYLRDLADRAVVERRLAGWLGASTAVFLQAELCRDELLVEVEGVVVVGE